MKKTLITAVALAACAGTQLFAQNAKEGVITFALSLDQQASVSTSPTVANQGNWSQGPQYYKSQTVKRATVDVLRSIGAILHKNAGYYSPKAQLVLVQGELGGFFNIGDTLGGDIETDLANGNYNNGGADTTPFASTIDDIGAKLASGRHLRVNPINGIWPPGHHQPWGQIFVKDPGKTGFSAVNPLCENVTFFFSITVQECYDCLFLNSFVTDARFKYTAGPGGIPCCGVPVDLNGNGKDRYYMTLTFDNTVNNPFLNSINDAWIGNLGSPWYVPVGGSAVIEGYGLADAQFVGDGLVPDLLTYTDAITSRQGRPAPYLMRFTLNGIVTYTWTLKRINPSDVVLDFVGTAGYPVSGYGFVSLLCSLITGNVGIAEKIAKAPNCCLDLPWYDAGPESSGPAGLGTGGWYGVGWNLFQDQYPLPPGIAGDPVDGWYFESPINTPNDISMHLGYNEWNEVRYQWPQSVPSNVSPGGGDLPAQPESIVGTRVDSLYIPVEGFTRVPSARGWTDRSNTDWSGGGK